MDSPFLPYLIGGLISLVSALAVVILQHKLSMQKMVIERRHHPFRVVYDKQIEFFDSLAPILLDLNSYITAIDVWLGEASKAAKEKVKEAAENNQAVAKFDHLLQEYYMYLPEKLLEEANHLHYKCLFLSSNPNSDNAYECIELLFSFQNSIRGLVGVEKLSEDFLRAFTTKQKDIQ